MRSPLEWIWEHAWRIWEPRVLASGYNAKNYWESRGRFFHLETVQRNLGWQHELLVQTLQKISWNSLLEVGCGFGRNLKLLRQHFPHATLSGIDLSESMLKKFRHYVNDSTIAMSVGSVTEPPLNVPASDVVLTHGLLMHIPPEKLPRAISTLSTLAKKTLISVEQIAESAPESPRSVPINKFTFVHPYQTLGADQGWTLRQQSRKGMLGFFLYEK